MKKIMTTALVSAMLLGAVPGAASASDYNVTVPAGESAETDWQLSSSDWTVHSHTVGGDYTLQAWIENTFTGVNVSDKYRITDGTKLDNKKYTKTPARMVHLNLNADWNTPVDVRATGWWVP